MSEEKKDTDAFLQRPNNNEKDNKKKIGSKPDDFHEHNNENDDGYQYLKLIHELQQTNHKFSSDFKLIRNKLRLDDQTTQIQFQLLQKELAESKQELDQSKVEAQKMNRLVVSLFQRLRPEFKALSSVDEMLSGLDSHVEDEEKDPLLLSSVDPLEAVEQQQSQEQLELQQPLPQQPQQQEQPQEQEQEQEQPQQQEQDRVEEQNASHRNNSNDSFNLLLEEKDDKIKKLEMQKDELFSSLKEDVRALKRREVQRSRREVCFSLDDDPSSAHDNSKNNDGLSPSKKVVTFQDNNMDEVGDDESSCYDKAAYYHDEEEIMRRMSVKEEELEHHFLPSDTYSYFAVADYFAHGDYCFGPTPEFTIASFALIIQIVTLSIFTMDVVDYKNVNNPISVPPGVSIQVRVSQLIALLISCWNQDEIRESFNVLSLGYRKEKVRAINCNATHYKWFFSIYIRIFLGCFSLAVTFILIINSETVRDVMLDFAAVTFVSELDNGAFQLSLWGYMGREVQQFTMRIKNLPVYEKVASNASANRKRKIPRLVYLVMIIGIMMGFWGWITKKQEHGDYLDQSIFVQFGDDFSPALGAFSGIYAIELDDTIDGMRVNYAEMGGKSNGRFSYCSQDRTWIFQYGDEPEGYKGHLFSECWYKARSSETFSYDLTKTTDITWFVMDEDLSSWENPLQHIVVKGQNDYYGKSCEKDNDCGKRMYCTTTTTADGSEDDKKTCVCEDGLFGLNCEFRNPCQTLEIDTRDPNGFFGTRSWSRRYSSLPKYDAGQEEDNNNNNSNYSSPIQVYGKPVYVGDESIEGIMDVMIFTGRRWILTDSISITDYIDNKNMTSSSSTEKKNNKDNAEDDEDKDNMIAKRELAEFLASSFHAYWSNYTFHFASEPVDVGTPTDSATPVGLKWFRLETIGTTGASLRSGEEIWQGKMSIEANLICAVCHNETNPCYYGATCQADGTCDCTTRGSSGRICQIPPDNNGNCDVFFNTPEFAFDGGDCCQETCRSTERFACGKGILENTGSVAAYGFIGYPNCQDPRFKSKLSGSTTLYEIVDRGFVRCGSGAYPGFLEISDDGVYSGLDVDLCKSLAGAALGDPDAFQIVETDWTNRWGDLTGGKFDILLFRTTHNAERDIFQNDAKQGFSFATTPNFFDGLRYAGIPPYAGCADRLDFESPECMDLRVCAALGTTWYEVTERLFPQSMIVAVDNVPAEIELLEAGVCNAIAGEVTFVAEFSVRDWGFTGSSYEVGNNVYSKEPLSAVTLEDDRVWSKFVQWTFEALIQAEESGIDQLNADRLGLTDVFGEPFQNMFRDAVAAAGNFGEIYERSLEDKIPRVGWNNINTGGGGLIYSFPFGSIDTVGEGPTVGGTIEAIRKRGVLHCGIKKTPGFAMLDAETGIWRGFEVDMCRGIAAALFNGSPNVNFIPLTSTERFEALADGTIDVLTCTTTHTLAREVNEVSTGQGFDFTPTIFHDGMAFAGRMPYVACAEMRRFDNIEEDCQNTRICTIEDTTWADALMGPLNIPEHHIVMTVAQDEIYQRFIDGDCNVIVGESAQVAESTVRALGVDENEEYVIGSQKYTKEPLAIVSRSDDAQFSDFLRWIVYGFFYAEEHKITRDEYFDMPAGNYLFGSSLSTMWQHSIEAVGNYGEMFERNFDGIFERSGLNNLNDGNGQFYTKPGITVKYR